MGLGSKAIYREIKEIEKSGLDIEDKENIEDYLGVNAKEKENGNIKLTQPQIIDSIINNVQFPKNTTPIQTPALSTKILRRDAASPIFDESFNYRGVVGKLNFLEKSTWPDITYAMHKCAHLSQDPRESHGDAIIHLVKYLKATREQVIMLNPKGRKSFEVYANTNFRGNWHRPTAGNNPSIAKYRTGYAILYAGCPII